MPGGIGHKSQEKTEGAASCLIPVAVPPFGTSPRRSSVFSPRAGCLPEVTSIETAVLSAAVWVARTGVERGVRPVALDLPLRPIREPKEWRSERPGAFVGILLAVRIVPGVQVGVGERLGELMAAHVGKRRHALGVQAGRILRVAAGIAIEIEE